MLSADSVDVPSAESISHTMVATLGSASLTKVLFSERIVQGPTQWYAGYSLRLHAAF